MDSGYNKLFFEEWIRYTAIASDLKKVVHSLLKMSFLKVDIFWYFLLRSPNFLFFRNSGWLTQGFSLYFFFKILFYFSFYTFTKKTTMKIFGWQGGSSRKLPSEALRMRLDLSLCVSGPSWSQCHTGSQIWGKFFLKLSLDTGYYINTTKLLCLQHYGNGCHSLLLDSFSTSHCSSWWSFI